MGDEHASAKPWQGEKRAGPTEGHDNRLVKAKAKHKTSQNLKLAADAVAQADYAMARPRCPLCLEEQDQEGNNCRTMRCCGAAIHEACLKQHISRHVAADPDSDDESTPAGNLRCPMCNIRMRSTSTRRALVEGDASS